MDKIIIRKKTLYFAEMLYIMIPVIIFLFGWVKWYIAVSCCAGVCFCYKRLYESRIKNLKEYTEIQKDILIVGCFFLILIGCVCGWGRWIMQPYDYEKHNAILADLTERSWPVYYQNSQERSMLTYYIGQYLVPAAIGKLFGSFRVAEIMIYFWSLIGIVIIWLHLLISIKIKHPLKQLGSVFFFILFGPSLHITEKIAVLFKVPVDINDLNTDWFIFLNEQGLHFQYSSNFTLLNWVFPQAIVCWICVLFLIDFKDDIRYYVILLLPSMLFGILSFFGLAIIAALYAFVTLAKTPKTVQCLKQIFSIENLLSAFTLGSVLIIYFSGNMFSDKPDYIGFFISPFQSQPIAVCIFYVFCILPYPLFLMRWYRKDILYWIASGLLIILPIFHMGLVNDLMMRASIPALFIIMYKILDFLNKTIHVSDFADQQVSDIISKFKQNRENGITKRRRVKINRNVVFSILFALFIIDGTIFPAKTIHKIACMTNIWHKPELITWGTAEKYANRDLNLDVTMQDRVYNYFTYDLDDSTFYKYFARISDASYQEVNTD